VRSQQIVAFDGGHGGLERPRGMVLLRGLANAERSTQNDFGFLSSP
jgi:hypothetical protein